MNVIKINKFISFLFKIKETEKFFRVSIKLYRNICESLGEARNCVRPLAPRTRVPTQFIVQTFTRVSITL